MFFVSFTCTNTVPINDNFKNVDDVEPTEEQAEKPAEIQMFPEMDNNISKFVAVTGSLYAVLGSCINEFKTVITQDVKYGESVITLKGILGSLGRFYISCAFSCRSFLGRVSEPSNTVISIALFLIPFCYCYILVHIKTMRLPKLPEQAADKTDTGKNCKHISV